MEQLSKKELLPCPFCGGEAKKTFIGNDFTKKRSVEIKCTKCFTKQVTGAIRNNHDWCDKKGTEQWNQRFKVESNVPVEEDKIQKAIDWCDGKIKEREQLIKADDSNEKSKDYNLNWVTAFKTFKQFLHSL